MANFGDSILLADGTFRLRTSPGIVMPSAAINVTYLVHILAPANGALMAAVYSPFWDGNWFIGTPVGGMF